jgi:hypothetical protein
VTVCYHRSTNKPTLPHHRSSCHSDKQNCSSSANVSITRLSNSLNVNDTKIVLKFYLKRHGSVRKVLNNKHFERKVTNGHGLVAFQLVFINLLSRQLNLHFTAFVLLYELSLWKHRLWTLIIFMDQINHNRVILIQDCSTLQS